jgi:hypothetical protein
MVLLQAPSIHLDGTKSYLVSNAFLDSISLRVHSVYRTLHCVCCTSVHIPAHMPEHLKTHSIGPFTKDQEVEFMQAMKEFDVCEGWDIQLPTPCGPPIECLKVVSNGYCCNHCSYCIPTSRSFNNHWYSSKHKDNKRPSSTAYHLGFIQTFFGSNQQRWFEVIPALSTLPTLDPFAVYLKTEVPKFIKTINEPPTHVREVPPLLNVTGWHDHLASYTKTKADIQNIRTLVRLPPFKETTGLGRLHDITNKYMKDIRAKAHSSSIGIKCLLMECPR